MDSPYASSTDLSSDSAPDNTPQVNNYWTRHRAQERLEEPGAAENGPSHAPEDLEDIPLDDENSDQGEREEGYEMLDGPLVRGAMHRDRSMNELAPEELSDEEAFPEELRFDDDGMVGYFSAAMLNETEEESGQSTSSLIQNPSGTDIPQGVLAATAQIAQNNLARSYDNLTGGLIYTAQRAHDAMVTTTQAGGHLAEGALRAGNDVAIWAQERWPNMPRIINRGVLGSLTELVLEGVQALPPSDSIIRPQGRR
ncbi:uncharacterized protein BKA55DRAFT_693194 [Fusarium redolens]|uniref:Uncharacterized protein n=1 Tax=Fusarium redolens TaxID=48865 RepID=A0A9P9K1N5_FUSRE|nr:uncharacterized protein BKA55DRAFT_693194 [Fusarium redolens]KAH7240956.1 hypothetical protein BKA55DRAFT_693194 [Fusarium redolens]